MSINKSLMIASLVAVGVSLSKGTYESNTPSAAGLRAEVEGKVICIITLRGKIQQLRGTDQSYSLLPPGINHIKIGDEVTIGKNNTGDATIHKGYNPQKTIEELPLIAPFAQPSIRPKVVTWNDAKAIPADFCEKKDK